MVFARFLPKNEAFFELFDAAAENAAEVATVLAAVIAHEGDQGRQIRKLHDLEHRGAEITHRIYNALNSTFVTPLDREDIQGLAAEIDDFVDDLEEAAERLRLYQLTEPSETAQLFARIINEQARAIAQALKLLPELGKNLESVRGYVVEIHRLENEADDALRDVLGRLYADVTEVPELVRRIQWRELFSLLENATDRAEDVADVLEGILLKHG